MKAREFWVRSVGDRVTLCLPVKPEIQEVEDPGTFKVREVLPIDWGKVWKKYWEWHGSMKNENMYVDKIQELVERQLRGEE